MTVAMTVDRSGPAVLEALRALSPGEADVFEAEYRATLARAAESLDLGEAERVLTHWWGIVSLRLNPLTDSERELGDVTHPSRWWTVVCRRSQTPDPYGRVMISSQWPSGPCQ